MRYFVCSKLYGNLKVISKYTFLLSLVTNMIWDIINEAVRLWGKGAVGFGGKVCMDYLIREFHLAVSVWALSLGKISGAR